LLLTAFFDKRQVNHLSTACRVGLAPARPRRIHAAAAAATPPVRRRRTTATAALPDQRIKPHVNADYNAYMGGVDRSDQHKSYYSVGRKSKKWWRYVMWYILNVSIYNAYFVWKQSVPLGRSPAQMAARKKMTHRLFRFELIEQLIAGYAMNQHRPGAMRASRIRPAATMIASNAISHLCVKIQGRGRQCVQCKATGRKTPKGHPVESGFMCADCGDIALCKGECFTRYHSEHSA